MFHFWLSLALLVFCFASNVFAQSSGEETCDINGQIFQRGESLGTSFVTRCGSAENYPCFCNPDLSPQVECPYCGFALQDGGLLCGKDGEVHSFTDVDGAAQTCDCTAPLGGASPTYTCEDAVDSGASDGGGSCVIDLPDGTTINLSSGEPIPAGVVPNRCGDEFPCFCDPLLESQMSCPYCRFSTIDGTLACARDGQVVAFQDEQGINQMCSCNENGEEMISDCNPTNASTTGSNSNVPTQRPVGPPTDQQLDVCTLQDEASGQVITFRNGESYGDYLTTRCGSSADFPCYCNTALPNQIDCPYCSFVTGDGDLECAPNGDSVSFMDGDTYRTCSCEIATPGAEPLRTCVDGQPPPTAAPTGPIANDPVNNDVCTTTGRDGELVIIQNGESLADLYEGVCGSAEQWPAFCNVVLGSGTISRQQQGNETDDDLDTSIEYPYCIYEDTQSGSPICAKSNSQVTYIDDGGNTQRCSCLYLSPSLGGAQSTCTVVTAPPTAAPAGVASSPTLIFPSSSSRSSTLTSYIALFVAGASLLL